MNFSFSSLARLMQFNVALARFSSLSKMSNGDVSFKSSEKVENMWRKHACKFLVPPSCLIQLLATVMPLLNTTTFPVFPQSCSSQILRSFGFFYKGVDLILQFE